MNSAIKTAIDMAGTQKKLSEGSGVSQSMISQMLNNRKMASVDIAKKLSLCAKGKIPWYKFIEEGQVDSSEQEPTATTGPTPRRLTTSRRNESPTTQAAVFLPTPDL